MGRDAVTRRRVLQIAGTLGLAATVGACAQKSDVANSATSSVSPAAPTSARPGLATAAPPQAPAPQPTSTSAPAAAVAAAILCRDAWGARPAQGAGVPHVPTKLTLHHTGVVLGDNRNAPARLLQHQQLHQNDRGWIDIAYHVGVDRNGNIYQLRDPLIKGDTATTYDPDGHFLVLCEGNFDEEEVTPEQLHGAATAFAWAAANFQISSTKIEGHRDQVSTACPGDNLYAAIESGDLQRRVDELMAAGSVDLQPLCGDAGKARVAAIAAGG